MQLRSKLAGYVVGMGVMAAVSVGGAAADPVLRAVQAVEQSLEARVGFYMHDLQTGVTRAHAAEDLFPLNSTFKLLACGALLQAVDRGQTDLDTSIALDRIQVVQYSPAIQAHRSAGHTTLTLSQACQMVLSVSDNTAANIVLAEIGGPTGLTEFLRSIGDEVTRLDRWEPQLNEAIPGDPRDTTTPRAIGQSVQRLLLGDVLSPRSRAILADWLAGHQVADALFRSALPPDWSIEDRTGAGGFGSRSIVAVLYPPGRRPIIAALFITDTHASFPDRNEAAASVGAAIVASGTQD